jgi:serine/threonine protein kinase
MITGQLYFVAENRVQLMRLTQNKEFVIPEKYQISPEVKDLLYKGYEKDPHKRLSMKDYIAHPAFSYLQSKYGHLISISN